MDIHFRRSGSNELASFLIDCIPSSVVTADADVIENGLHCFLLNGWLMIASYQPWEFLETLRKHQLSAIEHTM